MSYPYQPPVQPPPPQYQSFPPQQQAPFAAPQYPHAYPPLKPPATIPFAHPPFDQTEPYQQTTSTNQILHVQNVGFPQPHILITSIQTSIPLYTIQIPPSRSCFSSSPHLTIQSCLNNSTIGTIRFRTMGSDSINLTIHGQAMDFKSGKWGMSSSRELKSKAGGELKSKAGGGNLKWKNQNVLKGGELKCLDEGGDVVARFEAKGWGKVQKEAKFEFGPMVAAGTLLMDEVVVSGLAMVEYQRRQARGVEAGAAVGGTAVAVSSALVGAGVS